MLDPEDKMQNIEKEYPEIDDEYFFKIVRIISKHTLTDLPAQWALYKAIEYIVRNKIPGDIVECGVWNGGSILLAAYALIHFGDTSRRLYLYDTFEGMPKPDLVDVNYNGDLALAAWHEFRCQGQIWGFGGTMAMVWDVVRIAGYPPEHILFVKGMVEDTLPSTLPECISILRLDTDLYSSTYHEFVHAYPILSRGGILIVDDYGSFMGSRKATDQYISENALPLFLTRINHGAYLAVKL